MASSPPVSRSRRATTSRAPRKALAVKAKVKAPPASAAAVGAAPVSVPTPEAAFAACVTSRDHLVCIRTLARKVQEHIRAIGALKNLAGTSAEGREKAIVAFHQRLLTLERALGQVLEDLRLG
jgi:hypothetical protein